VKLEVTEDGLLLLQTPMGTFGIAQRDNGIEVLFTPPGGKTRGVFAALLDTNGGHAFHNFREDDFTKAKLAGNLVRIVAHVAGARMGKAAKQITGTVSGEEFGEALKRYRANGGQQQLESLVNGGGFSLEELEALLGHPPRSWLEDKLEDRSLPGQVGGEKLLLAEDKLEARTREDKLEDPATIVREIP
jgi:hypothetical protein